MFQRNQTAWLLLGGLLLSAASASADTITVDADLLGTAMPWNWVSGGLNTSYQFGLNDGTGPTVITGDGLSFGAGTAITITILGGCVSVNAAYPLPCVGPAGYNGNGTGTYWPVNNTTNDATGLLMPSAYAPSGEYPIYTGQIIGVFTDASGALDGSPFVIWTGGNSPGDYTGSPTITMIVPAGAFQLQFGINDDLYSDNTAAGSFSFSVTGNQLTPEPASLALAGAGLMALGWVGRRKRLSPIRRRNG